MGNQLCAALILALAVLCAACEREPGAQPANVSASDTGRLVLVGCEGSLGNGNAVVTLYNPSTAQTTEDAYRAVNGAALGDVLQSIASVGDYYLLAVNNSDKVRVVEKSTLQLQGSIDVPKPRYMAVAGPDKVYVSALFSNKLYIINPATRTVTGQLTLPYRNSEGLLHQDGRLYISCWDTACAEVLCLDESADTLMPARALRIQGRAPQQCVADKDGQLWVLAGNAVYGYTASWSCFSPNGSLTKSLLFPSGADAMRPCLNPAKDTLYWMEVNYAGGAANNGIYRMPVAVSTLPGTPFITAQSLQYFWALGIEPWSGRVYVGDPKGFTQRGTVTVYQPDGTQVAQFNTGVGPGSFFFQP